MMVCRARMWMNVLRLEPVMNTLSVPILMVATHALATPDTVAMEPSVTILMSVSTLLVMPLQPVRTRKLATVALVQLDTARLMQVLHVTKSMSAQTQI